MLKNIIITIKDERSPGKKYPYYFYTAQCSYGGCTWWTKDKSLREVENRFVWHERDWHCN